MKKIILLFGVLLGTANAQTQIGADIDGDAAYYGFGFAVDMPDVTTIAVGTPFYYENDRYLGQVRVYKWNGSNWLPKGTEINGHTYDENFGFSISMPDENTLAIGAIDNNDNGMSAGQVRIYEWNGSDWSQKGEEINGEDEDNLFGFSISMPDENTIAIGAHLNNGSGEYSGHVRIYEWDGATWTQKGIDIDGEAAGDYSGSSVSMPDTNTVAIGAIGNDGNGDFSGHVRIYKWNGSGWIQKGADINGNAAQEQFGHAVDMPDANTVAIGTPYAPFGKVRIYKWNGSEWAQKGEDIESEIQDYFGYSISMPNENTIAIGAYFHDENGTDSGQVRIFNWSGSNWLQIAKINGEAAEDRSGISISMPDTETIAIGAYKNDGNGTDSGHVRIFDLSTLGVIDNTFNRNISVYPNPTKGKFTIDLGSEYGDIEIIIRNILGQEINRRLERSPTKKFELNIEGSNGLYLIELNTNNGKKAILKILKQ